MEWMACTSARQAEVHENAPMPVEAVQCGACAVLSLRGPMQCRTCMTGERKEEVSQSLKGACHFTSCSWHNAQDPQYVGDLDDLCVDVGEDPLDDDGELRDDYDPGGDIWRSLPATHKLASKASSFSFVRDEHDTIVNIAKESTSPQVSLSLSA